MQPDPAIAFLESIGGGEVLVIFVVILLLFGSKRIPEMARMLGRTSAQFQRAFQTFKDQLMEADAPPPPVSEKEPDAPPPEEYAEHPALPEDEPPRAG